MGWGTAALLTLAIVGGRMPPTDNSVVALLASDAPEVSDYLRFRQAFGSDDLTLVQAHGPDRFALLDVVDSIHQALRASPAAVVLTASTAYPSTLEVLRDPDLEPDVLERLAARLDGPLNRELGLLQLDPPMAHLWALLPPDATGAMLPATLQTIREAGSKMGVEVQAAGTAVLGAAIDEAGRMVETRALPAVIGLSALLLFVIFRRPGPVLIVLCAVGLVVLGTDRAYGALGGTVNVLVVVHRPIAFVLLLAASIHVVDGWTRSAAELGSSPAALRTVQERGPAIRWSLLTTAAGFGSLALSPLVPIRDFGLLTALELTLGIPVMLGLVPALLSFLPPGRPASERRLARDAARLVRLSIEYRWPVIAIGLGTLTLGAVSGAALEIDAHAINYFAASSDLRRDHDAIEAQDIGLQSLEVLLRRQAPWTGAPEDVEQLARFAEEVERLPEVTTHIDPSLFLLEAGHAATGRPVPPDPLTTERVWGEGSPVRRAFGTSDGKTIRCSFLIRTVDADGVDRISETVTSLAEKNFGSDLGEVTVTGTYRLVLAAQRSLLRTLVRSLGATAVVMQLVMLVVLRSWRVASIALLPNLLPVAVVFAVMQLTGLPLDLGTCMVAALSLGIAVDDTLHYLLAWRGGSLVAAAEKAGPAIIITSLTIALGFSSLIPGDFRPTWAFGLLASTAMLAALLGDLMLLPALLGRANPETSSESPGTLAP